MVDTNSDPRLVDYVIPSNDDASKSIEKVLSYLTDAISEGLAERQTGKDKAPKEAEAKK
jgi:small subunit ribosomal protein S2